MTQSERLSGAKIPPYCHLAVAIRAVPDGLAEVAALRRFVRRVDDGVGWAELPQAAAETIFARLRNAVLARLAACDPEASGWFSGRDAISFQIGRILTAHAGGSRGVPLGYRPALTLEAAGRAFKQAFPECKPMPGALQFPQAQPGRQAVGWPRVFGAATVPGGPEHSHDGSGPWFQIDMVNMARWERETQLVMGPDDRVRYVVKPEGETVLKRLLLQDAVDRGYVVLDLRAPAVPLPDWARLTRVR